MSGLAHFLVSLGFTVSGSDLCANAQTARLEKEGVRVFIGHDAQNIEGAQKVVVNSAIPQDNPELAEARRRKIPVYGRAELLSLVAGCFGHTAGVAGCHGKTTATAMCAHVLENCTGSCSAHIGGEDLEYGNFYLGGENYFVTEACEYKGNFLHLHPDTAIILNTDADHLECYRGASELEECYLRFASRAQTAVVPYGSGLAASLGGDKVTFGGEGADFAAVDERCTGGRSSFILSVRGRRAGRVCLSVYGAHNVLNALAAAAAADAEGIGEGDIISGLEHFTGTARRMERIGRLHGAECFADYAHHPAEIAAAVKTAKEMAEGRLYVVFQPHTYSRTKNLFGEFVSALSLAERLLVYRTFAAREYFDGEGSALSLAAAVRGAAYGDRAEDISEFASSAGEGDLLLFLGAGDIYRIAKGMVS